MILLLDDLAAQLANRLSMLLMNAFSMVFLRATFSLLVVRWRRARRVMSIVTFRTFDA